MSDWRAKRKAERMADLENDILLMRAQAQEDEKVIRAVENEDITVTAGYEEPLCCLGSEVKAKSLYLNSSDDFLLVEAGTNAKRDSDGATIITISRLFSGASKLEIALDDRGDTLNLVFKDKNSLSQAYATLKAAAVLLRAQQKEIDGGKNEAKSSAD